MPASIIAHHREVAITTHDTDIAQLRQRLDQVTWETNVLRERIMTVRGRLPMPIDKPGLILHDQLGRMERRLQGLAVRGEVASTWLDPLEMRQSVDYWALPKRRQRVETVEALLKGMEYGKRQVLSQFGSLAEGTINDLQRTIAATGLDPRDFLEGRLRIGQGGPLVNVEPLGRGFVPLPFNLPRWDELSADPTAVLALLQLHVERWDGLSSLLESLPLGSPLEQYTITSHYGLRSDPFRRTRALHTGIDLWAPRRTPVYATAAGKVITAGYYSGWGRLIEIDHGNGVVTRFSHLDRMYVMPGQRVSKGDRIGLLGNTGRSTAPHLHYEVVVHGIPRDPINFISASSRS
ncbi:M23 family metallopeptidase [Telmatospirillum sp. J64-1]|uniref:M23 family metallopeptidase n=1 Tax=Telmatospirillum sp. J64-1 TaxID=2502183 RepID=UPI00163DDA60|nr:M23 family metallopeptidase [Telmatospirillum sp. J64-1]